MLPPVIQYQRLLYYCAGAVNRGSNGIYWSSSERNATNAWDMNFNGTSVNRGNNNKSNAFSLRCVRGTCRCRFFFAETKSKGL
ncbi:MAG: hypothetical protein QM305_06065 [Bacteroidota bacterium]|nr:hypothetical protein [Bacteroidota bacterium]